MNDVREILYTFQNGQSTSMSTTVTALEGGVYSFTFKPANSYCIASLWDGAMVQKDGRTYALQVFRCEPGFGFGEVELRGALSVVGLGYPYGDD